jgi:hypothetical protein
MQWKSRDAATGRIDPTYMLNVSNRSTGEMYFTLRDWKNNKSYQANSLNIPVGRWVHLEAFYKKSRTDTGRVTIWQDGVQIYDIQNVKTALNSEYNGGGVSWSVINYTEGLSPSKVTIYADDAVISTRRIGP